MFVIFLKMFILTAAFEANTGRFITDTIVAEFVNNAVMWVAQSKKPIVFHIVILRWNCSNYIK